MPSSSGASAPPQTNHGFGRQAPDAVERGRLLAARHHRAHAGVGLPRIAHLGGLELGRECLGNRVGLIRRHEDAADRGTLLPGLHRDLAYDLAHEGVEGRARGRRARRKQRRVDAVGLDIDRHALRHHAGMAAHPPRGVGRAGECNDVIGREAVEQIAGTATEQAQRAIRQHLGGNHILHHRVRQKRGRRGGLGKNRDTCEQRHRGFLPQSPARKIEGIDVDGDATARHHQVNGLIVLGLGEPHRLLIEQHARVAQPGTEPGVIFERADAAVDVDGRNRSWCCRNWRWRCPRSALGWR